MNALACADGGLVSLNLVAITSERPRPRPVFLPRGLALSDEIWAQRHRWVTAVLLVHLPLLALWSLYRQVEPQQYLLLLFPAGLVALARLEVFTAGRARLSKGAASAAASAGLMTCAVYLVDVSGGYIEAHFHFFVLLPVVALYEAWTPFIVAIGVVLLDHGLVGTLWPHAVYGHSMMHMEHPWRFAIIHAGFVSWASIGSLVTWRLAESGRMDQQDLIAELHHRATHDSLTGLANRELLNRRMLDALAMPQTEGLTVMVMDLDRFKEINDTLGHAAGDELLSILAAAMTRTIEAFDQDALLARLGGDEFAVLVHGDDEDWIESLAIDLVRVATSTIEVSGVQVSVGVSIGLADTTTLGAGAAPEGPTQEPDLAQTTAQTLLRHADVAMYQAKNSGVPISRYDPITDQHAKERLNVLADLRVALATDNQIVLHYQPKFSLSDGRLNGVEALARWAHPTRGLLPPSEFVDLAQSTQHASDFTRRVVETALDQIASWSAQGWDIPVAVNVLPSCLLRRPFVEFLEEEMTRRGVPAHLVRVEITEDAIVSDPKTAALVLADLHHLGVGVSIDDFGTGFSSLSYLRHLRVDELKIDRSFVKGLGLPPDTGNPGLLIPSPRGGRAEPAKRDAADEVLVAAIIDLAHNLGLHVVAEGIEHPREAELLTALGCDTAQGFLYARPLPPEQLTYLLTQQAGQLRRAQAGRR